MNRPVFLTLTMLASVLSPAAFAQDAHETAIAVVDRSGVDENLATLLKAYAPGTTTGQITQKNCAAAEWKAHLGIAVVAAVAKHGPAWNEANAQILIEHIAPEQLAAVLDYEPRRMQAETYGTLPPEVLQAALDGQLQPIVQLALVDVIAYLFEHCGASTP